MKTVFFLLIITFPGYLAAQQNLSWEEKVSPKYSYKLPENEQNTNKTNLNPAQRTAPENPYDKLLAQRDELNANIAFYEKQPSSEKNKQYLDKYRSSLVVIEQKIKDYQAPQRKEKAKN